jgi:outer membrane protein, heavy metal efflux system
MFRIPLGMVVGFCSLATASLAQVPDTLKLTLPDAEKIFLQNNLELIAQRYNVDINKALVEQAHYWDNPVLNTDQNIYDGAFFRHDANYGQVYIQLVQLIRTAGKRNKEIQLASDQVLSSEQQFNELLRNIRYLLRSDFNTLSQQFRTLEIYRSETDALQRLSTGMEAQFQAGNISQKDNIRVKALLFSIQSDAADLQRQIADLEKEFVTLLQIRGDTVISPQKGPAFNPGNIPALAELLDSARAHRPDLKLAATNLLSQQHNLSLQKAQVVPDVSVGVEYDHASTYVPNFWGLQISLPLPLFNRNKGNIKAAEFSIRQADVQAQSVRATAEQQVIGAYHKFLSQRQLQQGVSKDFLDNYNLLMERMTRSYQDRQVSLLEFIDFFDAYKDAVSKQLLLETNLRNAAEELNYSIGFPIIPIM